MFLCGTGKAISWPKWSFLAITSCLCIFCLCFLFCVFFLLWAFFRGFFVAHTWTFLAVVSSCMMSHWHQSPFCWNPDQMKKKRSQFYNGKNLLISWTQYSFPGFQGNFFIFCFSIYFPFSNDKNLDFAKWKYFLSNGGNKFWLLVPWCRFSVHIFISWLLRLCSWQPHPITMFKVCLLIIILIIIIITSAITIIIITRPKPAYGLQGLAGSWGQDIDQAGTS